MVLFWGLRDVLLKVNRMVNLGSVEADRVFHALSDATRRQMLATLAQGEATVKTLAEPHQISLVAVSKHLRVLEQAGLVRSHKLGRARTCAINPTALTLARDIIDYYQTFWEQRLDHLEAFLSTRQEEKR